MKIPVAIKVLQDGCGQSESLLEEARIMASVDHPCCVRILAACMTAEMMLVTQLMPLGSLLDYVRKNKDNVGSKAILNWATQIARVSSVTISVVPCARLCFSLPIDFQSMLVYYVLLHVCVVYICARYQTLFNG